MSPGQPPREAITVNGQLPAPLLRFVRKVKEVVLSVTNALDTDSSLYWHGLSCPTMDGARALASPVSNQARPSLTGSKIQQSGTYWYHSHSDMQEQAGLYGPIIIEPVKPEPYRYDRDYVIMLSDWTDQGPHTVMSKLKKQSDYYNSASRPWRISFASQRQGWDAAVQNRLDWGQMRMMATDIADVAGYTFLVNGRTPDQNWAGCSNPASGFTAAAHQRLGHVDLRRASPA